MASQKNAVLIRIDLEIKRRRTSLKEKPGVKLIYLFFFHLPKAVPLL